MDRNVNVIVIGSGAFGCNATWHLVQRGWCFEAEGLYLMTDCQEGGITHGPGLGKMISEPIVGGSSAWNSDTYRLTRQML